MTTAHLDALSRDVVARHPGEPEFPGFGVVCLAQEMSATARLSGRHALPHVGQRQRGAVPAPKLADAVLDEGVL